MLLIEAFTAEPYYNVMEKIKIEYTWCHVNNQYFMTSDDPDKYENQCKSCSAYSGGKCSNTDRIYRYFTGKCNYALFKLNVPALTPLKPKNNGKEIKNLSNVFLNDQEVSNFVTSTNYIELPPPQGVILPDILPAGSKFFLLSPDNIPEHGVLIYVG